MQTVLLGGGLLICIIAGAIAWGPQSFARNWVSGKEWQADPDKAARKQRNLAHVSATVMGLFGLLLVVIGLVS